MFLTKDLHAKVADFDFLIEIPQGCVVTGLCGTPGYIAPEMLTGTPAAPPCVVLLLRRMLPVLQGPGLRGVT